MIDLKETCRLHGLWLAGDSAGVCADLTGAVLRGAVLTDAVLTDAVLRGADLTGADLTDADLRGADLRGAVLRGAVLTDAVLRGADLRDADLTGAVLRGADLTGAVLTDADVLRVPQLHLKTLAALDAGALLDMSQWHLNNASCGTQHCRAGWAIHFAGGAGALLEQQLGPAAAGAIIIAASCPFLEKVPNFFTSNEEALEDIRRCAQIEIGLLAGATA